jgi:hypothetical protein
MGYGSNEFNVQSPAAVIPPATFPTKKPPTPPTPLTPLTPPMPPQPSPPAPPPPFPQRCKLHLPESKGLKPGFPLYRLKG